MVGSCGRLRRRVWRPAGSARPELRECTAVDFERGRSSRAEPPRAGHAEALGAPPTSGCNPTLRSRRGTPTGAGGSLCRASELGVSPEAAGWCGFFLSSPAAALRGPEGTECRPATARRWGEERSSRAQPGKAHEGAREPPEGSPPKSATESTAVAHPHKVRCCCSASAAALPLFFAPWGRDPSAHSGRPSPRIYKASRRSPMIFAPLRSCCSVATTSTTFSPSAWKCVASAHCPNFATKAQRPPEHKVFLFATPCGPELRR